MFVAFKLLVVVGGVVRLLDGLRWQFGDLGFVRDVDVRAAVAPLSCHELLVLGLVAAFRLVRRVLHWLMCAVHFAARRLLPLVPLSRLSLEAVGVLPSAHRRPGTRFVLPRGVAKLRGIVLLLLCLLLLLGSALLRSFCKLLLLNKFLLCFLYFGSVYKLLGLRFDFLLGPPLAWFPFAFLDWELSLDLVSFVHLIS